MITDNQIDQICEEKINEILLQLNLKRQFRDSNISSITRKEFLPLFERKRLYTKIGKAIKTIN